MSSQQAPNWANWIHLPDPTATAVLAQHLAPLLARGDLVALWGDLGVGKTELARALIRSLTGSPEEEVPSPTFTLLQSYETLAGPIHHFDLYRIRDPRELVELGWDDALAEGIVLVEWPERAGSQLPDRRLDLRLTVAGAGREALLTPRGGWEVGKGGFGALQRPARRE